MQYHLDLLILGAGPAGLALAGAAAGAGLRVGIAAPEPDAPWRNGYGLWADEWPESLGSEPGVALDQAEVHFAPGELLTVRRRYLRVHNPALQDALRRRLGGVRVHRLSAVAVRHDPRGSRAIGADGAGVDARIIVDATGPKTTLLRRSSRSSGLAQAAVGWLAEADGLPRVMRWMDFSHRHDDGDPRPTFLYALPLPGNQWFFEETSLAADPPMPRERLVSRLTSRLSALGVRLGEIKEEERCLIPLDVGLPRRDQRLLGFGAAASLVHPATGYQLARALALAPEIARALAGGLAGSGPAEAVRRAWAEIWPAPRRRARELYRFGARAVARLGHDETVGFFRSFFAQRPEIWQAWLADRLEPGALAIRMAALFVHLPAGLKIRVLGGSCPV